MRITTGCGTLDQFTAVFRSLCTEDSIFIPTAKPLAQGTGLHFAFALKTRPGGVPGRVLLRGHGKISQSYPTSKNAFGRAGMSLTWDTLDSMGRILVRELSAGPKPGDPAAGAGEFGDSDESFDISTLVESGSLATVKAEHMAKEAQRRTASSGPGSALGALTRKQRDALSTCEVSVATRGKPAPMTAVGDDRSITNVAPDVPVGAHPETTEVAEEASSEPTQARTKTGAEVVSDATEVDATQERLPNRADGPGAMSEDEDEDEDEDEATYVSAHPAVGLPGEDAGAVTAVGTPPADPLASTQLAPRDLLNSDDDSAEPTAVRGAEEVLEEVTQVPAVSKQIAARVNPAIASMPKRPAPGQAPAPRTRTRPPLVASPPAAPASRTPPPLVAAPAPTATPPVGTPPPAVAPAPIGATPAPVTPPPPSSTQRGAEAISAALEEAVVDPTVASKPLPGVPTAPKTAPGARSIASLPMVTPGIVGGATSAPPSKAMVTRKQAGLFGGLCLVAGLGFGLLLGGGAETTRAPRVAAADPSGKAPVVVPVIVPAATRPVPADASEVRFDAAAVVDAAVPDEPVFDAAAPASDSDLGCEILLEVEPADARVLVGAVAAEPGATSVPVACGAVVVSVEHDEYINYRQTLEVESGTAFPFSHQMKREMVTLRVFSTPRKAWVQLDGEGLGKTPKRHKVPAFVPLELRVSKAGFKPKVQKIVPKEDMQLDVRLRRWGKKRKAKKRR